METEGGIETLVVLAALWLCVGVGIGVGGATET